MAKPRVFVSSTYYDLKHIRNSLEIFIDGLGYESVLYEQGDIPFHHDSPLDVSCYDEIKNCHILVLIIGGRYGSPSSDTDIESGLEHFNSVTKKEYETARVNDIPIYIFIEKNVHSEYHTYKKNRHNKDISYAHVDNVNIFKLIDDIYSQKRNNLVRDFEKFDDLSSWLRDQWAGLFADLLAAKKRDHELEDLSSQVAGLKDLSSVLKSYTESIMSKLQPDNFEQIIKSSNSNLRSRALRTFEKHPLVVYLLEKSPKGIGIVSLYEAFLNSESIGDALIKCNYTEDFIKDLLKHPAASEDFNHLKREVG
ncbi:protein of unknown function [Pseudomonas reinekei]|uniref:DUF4062 domain-containing protein n=1 Tax=Pseudomonas reinekei TaxID=395598 RepID=A0A1H0T2A5_PSERE|nr:DUF4062 domain-containing protein [Pseudomonas reinekei]KAB0482021.1 DUF4062 domain-containing protein [Pseudomonas reinekei]OLT99950.1 hypothetical protein BVK86_23890 [Pseudomonas reinekei]SDP47706.1 protein of unknown function [Pseudomonas reinekei]